MHRLLFACALLITSTVRAEDVEPPYISPLDSVELPAMERARVLRGTQIPAADPNPNGMSLARRVSLRERMSPVKSQGYRGTCSVFATVALLEFGRNVRLSEQCLAAHMGKGDPGKILDRLNWATHNPTYLEHDCPYNPDPEQASVLPPLGNAYNFALRVQSQRQEFGWFSHEDPIAFIRKSLNEGKPVGGSVIVAGNWWRIPAPSPTRVRTEQRGSITVRPPPHIIAGYPDHWDDAFPPPNPDGTITIPLSTWADIDMAQAVRDPSQRELLRKHYFEPGKFPTGRYWDPITKEPRDRDFDTWFAHAARLDVPSDAEVRESCSEQADNASAEKCGLHAIVFTGYDDESQTLEFKNSWGQRWKNEGYGFMSYAYYRRFHAAFSSDSALVAVTNLYSGHDPVLPVGF